MVKKYPPKISKPARRIRCKHTPTFKTQVMLAALREAKALAELCQQFERHPNQISDLNWPLLGNATHVFGPVVARPNYWLSAEARGARMDRLMPGAEFCAVIEPHYPKAGNGCRTPRPCFTFGNCRNTMDWAWPCSPRSANC